MDIFSPCLLLKYERGWNYLRAMAAKPSKIKLSIGRRNTFSHFYDDILAKAENTDSDHGGGSSSTKRMNKRQMKLLRGSERDLKLDIASAQAMQNSQGPQGYDGSITPQPSYQVECNSRFMCLSGRRVCKSKTNRHSYDDKLMVKNDRDVELGNEEDTEHDEAHNNRVEFHQTLCLLVRMGCSDKNTDRNTRRGMSREECLWHEYRDVIWLELRAYHANRTTIEEDEYLYGARQEVETLLKDIMSYRYTHQRNLKINDLPGDSEYKECPGCLSLQCEYCLNAQTEALKQIEDLSARLEKAEALFPSGKAFAEMYPLYRSCEFEARAKTISLWLNMVRLLRLMLMLLGRFIFFLDTKNTSWSVTADKSMTETNSSPSDSNNSNSSNDSFHDIKTFLDTYSNSYLWHLMSRNTTDEQSPYRRYIEHVLKTKALKKSLNFLDELHTGILKRAKYTLERPEDQNVFKLNVVETEEDEMIRYGAWSPEAQAINLPSYRAAFLFLSAVPLEVIHQFMLLRLEQRPPNPSPLSIRQLMRELKDGLDIAVRQRIRTEQHINAAIKSIDVSVEEYSCKLKIFDDCLARVFEDYLDYLGRWALFEHETFQKNMLEEEWHYSNNIIDHIPNGKEKLEDKFCQILSSIMKTIRERLTNNIEHLVNSVLYEDDMKCNILSVCRELQTLLNEEREMSIKTLSFSKLILKNEQLPSSTWKLKEAVISFKFIVPKTIEKIQSIFSKFSKDGVVDDEIEKTTLVSRVREILMQAYKFGFEFYKEMSDFVPPQHREKLAISMMQFANLWMKFVVEKCDRGRGMRPRWAYQGMEFLVFVCEPRNTKYLTDAEFEDLQKNMDHCISHVIGTTAPSTPESGFHSASPRSSNSARSRGSSPSPRPTYKSQRSSGRRSHEKMSSPSSTDGADFYFENNRKLDIPTGSDSTIRINLPPSTHAEKVTVAVEILDNELDDKLRKQGLIGKVNNQSSTTTRIRQRNVNFTWQRGIKIGQGRFGKVYTAVNNSTGEMMAVKEIPLQPNDNVTLKRVSEEVKILEGIAHMHLVKYYGIEVHREEMLLFMEYCQEGTLESLVAMTENGLPELLVRRYTFQLVSGVRCLHNHGVVHRDIKTANIFLTQEGNCLKIGDFGCAVKIKFNSTMPGELKGFVGTQAYMAPEVFTRNMNEGHGRAADIWSVGCVVVEMSSGKRPWWQYDSNYQIMFKVGMGQSPDPPDTLIDEGLDFLELCFKFDPRERASAHELLEHNFVKFVDDS
ncbi:hypothetical protein WA026_009078 [Henosepilachna vigintioctopunctata]|uniref:Mitogen-activated protein kinase kinase kinase 4 n=1 Tax=Henosepilachna vigintioctopunctata TaxID=420089 RepID=A0AAW1UVL0_9CUCU